MSKGLWTLFHPNQLRDEIEAGYVSARPHPLDPSLVICNYTHQAAYDHRWNNVTRACRGLIAQLGDDPDDLDGPEIVARPFEKFFNYGEHLTNDELPSIPLHEGFKVTSKEDGSLGIWYMAPDGPAIATRGSFSSEQAEWATKFLRENWGDYRPSPGTSPLFEIIYPANRIVLDYGDRKDLIHLATIDIETGRQVEEVRWDGPRVESYSFAKFEDLLSYVESQPSDNREGFVVTFDDSGLMTKLKFSEYVALHRILTGLSERRIWEHLAAGGNIADFVEAVPDEFYDWVHEVEQRLRQRQGEVVQLAQMQGTSLDGLTRKEVAAEIQDEPNRSLIWLAYDGQWGRLNDRAWALVRPEGHVTFREDDE